jgi:hypothetical protein
MKQFIDEGNTNEFLIHGVFLLIAAGLGGLIHYSITILLFPIGILLFMVKSGVEIDISSRKIRVCKYLFGSKKGTWIDLEKVESFEIKITKESGMKPYRGGDRHQSIQTYDLHFNLKDGSSYEFHPFDTYRLVRKTVQPLEEMGFVVHDKILEKLRRS